MSATATPVAPPRAPGATASSGSRSGDGNAALTAEDYRVVAILVLGLIVKVGLVAALLGFVARGGWAVWRRLWGGGRR